MCTSKSKNSSSRRFHIFDFEQQVDQLIKKTNGKNEKILATNK